MSSTTDTTVSSALTSSSTMSTSATSASESSSAATSTPTSSPVTTTSPTSVTPTSTTVPTTTPTSSSFSTTTTATISSPVTTTVLPTSTTPPPVTTPTSTFTPTTAPESTSPTAVTTVITSTLSSSTGSTTASRTSSSSSTSTSTPIGAGSNASDNGSGGLGTGGVTAIAVVIPVVVVALLVIGGIFWWRRRRRQQAAAEARRKEVEDYGYNPNNDPTLPSVASDGGHEMAEDTSGYRGWGAAAMSSRKMSTTLSGGHTQGQLSGTGSDAGYSHMGGASPNPPYGPPLSASDAHSGDPLVGRDPRRETMSSDEMGALGMSAAATTGAAGVRRGPSNASSTYSHAGARSDVSDLDRPDMPIGQAYDYSNPAAYGSSYGAGAPLAANGAYGQHGPYGDGSYGGGGVQDGHAGGMPVVRDVDARRNTRIQQPGTYQQGNTGIAQNF